MKRSFCSSRGPLSGETVDGIENQSRLSSPPRGRIQCHYFSGKDQFLVNRLKPGEDKTYISLHQRELVLPIVSPERTSFSRENQFLQRELVSPERTSLTYSFSREDQFCLQFLPRGLVSPIVSPERTSLTYSFSARARVSPLFSAARTSLTYSFSKEDQSYQQFLQRGLVSRIVFPERMSLTYSFIGDLESHHQFLQRGLD